MPPFHAHLVDEQATRAFGARLAPYLQRGMALHLIGEVGAGKTTLARGLLAGLGFGGKVKSPSYALVELYELSSLDLYHFDFYRFHDPTEWHDAGFRELFNERVVCVVEWPEKAGDLLPPPDLRIALAARDVGRDVTVETETEAGRQCLKRLRAT
jgi:tRNA threonylcarbamoyladenosine biosynthesis protein TsaE